MSQNAKLKTGDAGHLIDVQVTPKGKTGHIDVTPIWGGVDRPNGFGWTVGNQRLADRLVLAIMAGAVFEDPRVREDINGRTYVTGTAKVLGRYLNADLRKLGY